MISEVRRRRFLQAASAAPFLATPIAALARGDDAPSEILIVGVMGMGGRGNQHAHNLSRMPGVELAYVCDVDERRSGKAADAVGREGKKGTKAVGDFRHILDDKVVDVLVVATCNHWHAPAAILACPAGKHVYVEKPCSHNPREGELLVDAARKHNRIVQMGNQRRELAEGHRGDRAGSRRAPSAARTSPTPVREQPAPSIGHGNERPVPEWLDYDLWQGPAPRRPYRDNILHYNWHWFWHWGNGELGNNGVHMIDVAAGGWASIIRSASPRPAAATSFDDDQETPDTHVVGFEFEGRKAITWAGKSCNPVRPGGAKADLVFYGEDGALEIDGGGVCHHRPQGEADQEGRRRWRRPRTPRQLPRLRPRRGRAQQRDRGGAQEHPALPPGEHCPPDRAPSAATRRTATSSTTPRP